jgi:uncharacterized protein YdiU (UPF0061 family)
MNTKIKTLQQFANTCDYSFVDSLKPNPELKEDKNDYLPREVFSGHYVLVNPTPIQNPEYITHSQVFFQELGLDDTLATKQDFMDMFSANSLNLEEPLRNYGWATGYALSIYGEEYYDQCPFKSGNAYGDGRAISIFEGVLNSKRWEMQLKGGGKTPYCRGADGRAVLRSSVREFLAQEHMFALGVPTSRSLTLYTSKTETVKRPWFTNGSYSRDPEVMIDEQVAISTRVAPSFIRIGQLELFARRVRKNEHPTALEELQQIVEHAINREYKDYINPDSSFEEKIINFATLYKQRLIRLVTHWLRVGFCQGNFNSDNCAIGGFGLDYGPFGFMDMFDPRYQSWTGGGAHFSFFNQHEAARKNFKMFCKSLEPLLKNNNLEILNNIQNSFSKDMYESLERMWAAKLGLDSYDENFFKETIHLMIDTSVDYTIFFRELCSLPKEIGVLVKSFYGDAILESSIIQRWEKWLEKWHKLLESNGNKDYDALSSLMKQTNPKYTLREWFLVPAYKAAQKGDYSLVREIQAIMNNPYDEQSKEIEEKYYRLKPDKLFGIAGVSFVSCSS